MRLRLTALFISFFLVSAVWAASQRTAGVGAALTNISPDTTFKFPKPVGRFNDFEGSLDDSFAMVVDSILAEIEPATNTQIAIITIGDFAPFKSMKEYGKAIGNAWGVGENGKNNGIVIVFSRTKREVRITTGSGIEHILTDSLCQLIIDRDMLPLFKQGLYEAGIAQALMRIGSALAHRKKED